MGSKWGLTSSHQEFSRQNSNLIYHIMRHSSLQNQIRSDFIGFQLSEGAYGVLTTPCLCILKNLLFSESLGLCLFWLNSMCPVADRPGLVVLREDGELPTAVTLEGSGWSQENPESASESLTSFCWTGVGNSGKRLESSLISAAVTRLTAKQNLGTEKTLQKSAILTLPLYFCLSSLHLSCGRRHPRPELAH